MNYASSHKIRPAGRHILTIGKELIQDKYAAILELVKNAYDADSPDVVISFESFEARNKFSITIQDHGHGMSRDTVVTKWMVPSTDDKLKRRESPGRIVDGRLVKRVMQGRKGVGRYAASLLGKDLLLQTVTPSGEKTTAYMVWSDFSKAKYMDEVEILIESVKSADPHGTTLVINCDASEYHEWNQAYKPNQTVLDKLKLELKKLISPVDSILNNIELVDTFNISVITADVNDGEVQPLVDKIEPFPVFEYFDYRISGHINSDGKGILSYSTQKARNTAEESFEFDFGEITQCGQLFLDIRVYDREKEAIDSLINRGLKDSAGNYIGNLEARRLLDDLNGIGVYRNGFRIRPLGDADFDWLKLNFRRVQIPTLRIGSNQVIGYILIQSEEESGLIEKSARDGLRENVAFEQLKAVCREVISKLETLRFDYRLKAGLSRRGLKIENELQRLFAFDNLKQEIRQKLAKLKIDGKIANEVMELIAAEEASKNKIADDIRQTVAVYQGQATLGKIINVILHEGRRPLNYFKNQIPHLHTLYNIYQKKQDTALLPKFVSITEGLSTNAEIFVRLFSRLDPLAAGKRGKKKALLLRRTIEDIFSVFHEDIKENHISTRIIGSDDLEFFAWPQDIYAIFTNLIDNSIYWMVSKKVPKKEIVIDLVSNSDLLYIDYRDTGPGIEFSHIESGVIFEPHFTTKPDGTGLGLAIAGEAALRNGLELEAFKSDDGAYFRLHSKVRGVDE